MDFDELDGPPDGGGATIEQAPEQPDAQPSSDAGARDWTKDPAYQRSMSRLQSQAAQAAREKADALRSAEAAQAAAEAAQAQVEALLGTMQQYDPDAAKELLQQAELDAIKRENARLKAEQEQQRRQQALAQEQQDSFLHYHVTMMQELGGDPDDPEYIEALESLDSRTVESVRNKLLNKSKPRQEETMTEEQGGGQPSQPAQQGHVTLPGRGAPSPSERSKLRQQAEAEYNALPQGDVVALKQWKDKWRKLLPPE